MILVHVHVEEADEEPHVPRISVHVGHVGLNVCLVEQVEPQRECRNGPVVKDEFAIIKLVLVEKRSVGCQVDFATQNSPLVGTPVLIGSSVTLTTRQSLPRSNTVVFSILNYWRSDGSRICTTVVSNGGDGSAWPLER